MISQPLVGLGKKVKLDSARVLFVWAVKLFTDGPSSFQWVGFRAFSGSLFAFEKSSVAALYGRFDCESSQFFIYFYAL